MRTRLRRSSIRAPWVVGAALTVGVLLTPAVPAAADVAVHPAEAVQGDDAVVTFTVSNDSSRVPVVKVRVSVPAEAKLTSVRTKPLAGWSADVFKAKVPQPGDVCDCLAVPTVTSITWTAHRGTGIAPGMLEEFSVLVERLPKRSSLTFATTQTYADGTRVGSEASRGGTANSRSVPRPVLRLVLRPAPGDASDIVPAAAKSDAQAGSNRLARSADPLARWLVAAGLALCLLSLGILGVRFGGVKLRRRA